jgi:indole-3-glycerol phosphate synthase
VSDILARIVEEKRKEVEKFSKEPREFPDPDSLAFGNRDFKNAISRPGGINLIAEIKFASPTAGTIRDGVDTLTVGKIYEQGGAVAVSLLTDKKFFGGDISLMPRLKKAISLPILRKDFIIHESQLVESFRYGADAVLLIVRLLSSNQLKELLSFCKEMGLAALTEVHDRGEINRAIECGADIIGINNRNLSTFTTTLSTTLDLASMVPEEVVIVSESGISSAEDIRLFRRTGIHAVLVGSSLMKSKNIGGKVRELVNAGRSDF